MANRNDNNDTKPGAAAVKTNYADKIAFLEERLQHHIDEYLKKRNLSRALANVYKVSVVVLGALITILLGAKDYFKTDITVTALVLSTVVTAITSWETFADYRGKWIRERSVLVTLYDILDDLKYALAGNEHLSEEKIDQFYGRLRLALNETNTQWMSARAKAIVGSTDAKPAGG